MKGVSARYRPGAAWALREVTLDIEAGSLVGLVGPNGSGKTTLYRLVLGLLDPQRGSVRTGGMEPAPYRRERGVGYLPEQVRLPGALRVSELAELMAALAGLSGAEGRRSSAALISELELESVVASPIGDLSHGYRQRVGLLAALLGDPRLVLLDEPANGLDPPSTGMLRTLLRRLRREGRTVVLSSHNLLELERLCDAVVIMRQGRVLGRVTRGQLLDRPDIWVVRLAGHASRPVTGDREYDAVRLAADEMAFDSREAALRFAARRRPAGDRVEAIERRRFDLEFLFHSLIRKAGPGGEADGP